MTYRVLKYPLESWGDGKPERQTVLMPRPQGMVAVSFDGKGYPCIYAAVDDSHPVLRWEVLCLATGANGNDVLHPEAPDHEYLGTLRYASRQEVYHYFITEGLVL